MSTPQSNRRRFSESINASSTPNQIIATLRSALPPGISSITTAQASQILSNSRSARLSEYANMLSIPSFNSGTLSGAAAARLIQNHNPAANILSAGASVHPSFRSKSVCALECRHCGQGICGRGMKAILLSDTRVFLEEAYLYLVGRTLQHGCSSFWVRFLSRFNKTVVFNLWETIT